MNVLIFPGGTGIGQEIRDSLVHHKDIKLFSADSGESHSPFAFKRSLYVPDINSWSWIPDLNHEIERTKIDYIFPAHDDVLVALATNRDKINAKIITSPAETCVITRSKLLTYKYLEKVVPTPFITSRDTAWAFPLFLKPEKGQGAKDTFTVYTYEELDFYTRQYPDLMILEHLPGYEYTVDCFTDRERGLIFCEGRRRARIKNGVCISSSLVYDSRFKEMAQAISSKLTFHGAWFFQVKMDKFKEFKLMEVAPRIAGTMTLNRVYVVNFPLLSIYEQERIPISIMTNSSALYIQLNRCLANHYSHDFKYDTVYVDLDDTLIIRNKVNVDLIKFLYQCVNKSLHIVLLTKNPTYSITMTWFRIPDVFDQIIQVKDSFCKSDYITTKSSIFIDDSFSERKEVSEKHGIPTFDCSMIEMLFDDRV